MNRLIYWGIICCTWLFYIIIPYDSYFEDSWSYYQWYEDGRDLSVYNEPALSVLYILMPSGLNFYFFKSIFGALILALFTKVYVGIYSYRIWPLILLFANPVFLDLLFNLSRSTIAILLIVIIMKSRFTEILTPLSILIHNKIGLIYTAILLIIRRPVVLLLLFWIFFKLQTFDWTSFEAYRRFGWYNITLSNQLKINLFMLILPIFFGIRRIKQGGRLELVAIMSVFCALIFFLLDSNYFYRFLLLSPLIFWSAVKKSTIKIFAISQVFILIIGLIF